VLNLQAVLPRGIMGGTPPLAWQAAAWSGITGLREVGR
jgi:hypothetical protein